VNAIQATLDRSAAAFAADGYVVLRAVFSQDETAHLRELVSEHTERLRRACGASPGERMLVLDFLSLDEGLLSPVDNQLMLALAARILGPNIYLYHTHWCVAPSLIGATYPQVQRFVHVHNTAANSTAPVSKPGDFWRWHRDGGNINAEAGPHPQPRLSLKAGVFLTDVARPGGGNMAVVPGSHLREQPLPANGADHPSGRQILAGAGDVVVFDRRIIHSSSPNLSSQARMVLFYGYGYRWLRPRDDMTVTRYLDRAGPVRRQLLGATSSGYAYSSPTEQDTPLTGWMAALGYPSGPAEDAP
jgi:ectoine hydroxylase-related dioxygenase (phytanoyl-CoA dioxygenase family)